MKATKKFLFILIFIFVLMLSACNKTTNTVETSTTTTFAIDSKTESKTNTPSSTTQSTTTGKQESTTVSSTTTTTQEVPKTSTTSEDKTTKTSSVLTPTSSSKQVQNYYKNFDVDALLTMTPSQIQSKIYSLISVADICVSYTNSRDYFYLTDENPETGKIQLFYSHLEVSATLTSGKHRLVMGSGSGQVNREHVWPQSLGDSKDQPGGHDLHHIRPTIYDLNSARGNLLYGYVKNGSEVKYDGKVYAHKNSKSFEPLDSVKGDVARILFYYAIKYGYSLSVVVSDKTYSEILEWNRIDPVSEVEINRNNVVETIQGNRNIFIDYPELAEYIWG